MPETVVTNLLKLTSELTCTMLHCSKLRVHLQAEEVPSQYKDVTERERSQCMQINDMPPSVRSAVCRILYSSRKLVPYRVVSQLSRDVHTFEQSCACTSKA